MDSITHIAVGALIGEAFVGKKLGKRAIFYGALSQSIPDFDVVAVLWSSPAENLLAHRGFMHSFFFAMLVGSAGALLAERHHRSVGIPRTTWLTFFIVELFTHLLLDGFNAYGVGWFEPFSHVRISLHTIFVADPFFSVVAGIAFIVLLFLKRDHAKRMKWVTVGLVWCGLYLGYAIFNKVSINRAVERTLAQQQIAYHRYFTSPAAFNNWLWYIVVEQEDGYYIGYRSVFDSQKSIDFTYFPQQDFISAQVEDQESLNLLLRFSQGYYTLEAVDNSIVFNDLRFGQISGWQNPQATFAFHYYLTDTGDNTTVIQRGRLAGWNRNSIAALVKRIKGN